jgi:acetyltransferase-like isoleucine patch superfamily enzyme
MKAFLKKAVYVLSLVVVSPLILIDRIERWLSKSEQAFVFMGQLLGLVPGQPGSCLRAAYYSATLDEASPAVHIGFGSIFCHRDAAIGRHTSVGMHCIFGCVRIGEEVMIANRVSIPSGKRQHLDETGDIVHTTRRTTIHVGSLSWIGDGAIIMHDMGENCILGAGSVVTKALPAGSTASGNPAKVLRRMAKGAKLF